MTDLEPPNDPPALPFNEQFLVPGDYRGRAIPYVDNPERRGLAFHVGAVVLLAGQLDAAMSALVALKYGRNEAEVLRIGASSGSRIRSAVKAHLDQDEPLGKMLTRYEVLYEARNQLIHSIRPDLEDVLSGMTMRANMKATGPNDFFILKTLGIGELIAHWYDTDELLNEVRRAFFEVAPYLTLSATQEDQINE